MQKDEYTLEELAAATGMTARNVRAYQTKGLIPAPARAGRRSVYGEEHLVRLQAIEHARSRGASLSLIATHLAAGRTLDDETLVGWTTDPSEGAPGAAQRTATAGAPGTAGSVTPSDAEAGEGHRQDIAPLLAHLDHQSARSARADVAELVAAGVLTSAGDRLYTGRELADSLTELHRRGFPLQVALRTVRRALAVAGPLTVALREVTEGVEGSAVRVQLGEAACYVVRHLLTRIEPLPADGPPDVPT